MAYINLGQVVYPVGSVYISYTSISPASLFGGNWTAITGHFPYFNAGNTTGGSNSVNHSHDLDGTGYADIDIIIGGNQWLNVCYRNLTSRSFTANMSWAASTNQINKSVETNTHPISLSGSTNSSSINNMPAYQTFYAWRRTS